MAHGHRHRTLSELRRRSTSAIVAVLVAAGAVAPASAQQPERPAPHDPAVLADIARDVLARASAGADHDLPEPSSRIEVVDEIATVGGAPDPAPPVSDNPAPRQGTRVSAPLTASPPKHGLAAVGATGYESNSWRQMPAELARSLTFSSGALLPSSGVDPALRTRAAQALAEGRPFIYGFVLLRGPVDGALESALTRLGVQLLGPHDNHQKARLPVGSLDAVAALAEVEWLGVSPPEQKSSVELTEARDARARVGAETSAAIPIVINLFEADASGAFRRELEAAGATLGKYDAALHLYQAVATEAAIDRILALDFVLFVEVVRPTTAGHDQSTPLIDADLIRPGGSFPTRYGGASSTLGIMDTGFMLGTAATVMHGDLNKNGCGANFTSDAAGVWNDQHGHGTHVLTTIAGTGAGNSRYRGVATGVGSTNRVRAAKIWTSAGSGTSAWMESAMDFMANASECGSPAPLVINISGGAAGTGQTGTDSTSRKLDDRVWTNRQTYVVCSGNSGPGAQTIWSPGVAKNALTVGNALDNGYLTVGDISNGSSRGPTGDGRMKPNLVAPGNLVTSAWAGTTGSYTNMQGCSMATPHVSGLAATLMEHYPEFQNNPALLRAHMMASTIAHDNVTGMSNDYGIGRVSGYLEHWAQFDAAGWSTHWFWGSVSATNWQFGDITVPAGTQRLVIVLTWDEPAASAGASRAVTYDVDLWVDHGADCSEPNKGACGEWASVSSIDSVEYIVLNNPTPGVYRLKASNYNAPTFALPYGLAAFVLRGDPTPPMTAVLTAPASVQAGSTFAVTATVSNPSYIASGVQVALTSVPAGVTLLDVQTTRSDGVPMSFLGVGDALTLGNIVAGFSRSVTWLYRADTVGAKPFTARAWSENGGTLTPTATAQVVSATNLAVVSPNGGEIWPIGSTRAITWTSSGLTGNVKIEVSRDGGATWASIIGSTANDGTHNWIVTGPASAQARVRVTSLTIPTVSDASNGNFTLGGGTIAVTSPNGGETWGIGSTHAITWTSTGLTGNVKIELSRNGGASWTSVIASTANDGTHNWIVTSPGTSQARFRVTSVTDPTVSDTSNGNFTLGGGTITVTSPNGSEIWAIGSTHAITWTSSGLGGNVKIEVSRNGGASWTSVVASTANDGTHNWIVTGPATAQARFRVTSVADPTVSDTSNGNFTLGGGAITVTSPNGGEVWAIGSTRAITWTSSGLTGNVKIEVSRNGGASWTSVLASTANDGTHNWIVTSPGTSQARFRVTSVTDPTVSDTSNANFTVQ